MKIEAAYHIRLQITPSRVNDQSASTDSESLVVMSDQAEHEHKSFDETEASDATLNLSEVPSRTTDSPLDRTKSSNTSPPEALDSRTRSSEDNETSIGSIDETPDYSYADLFDTVNRYLDSSSLDTWQRARQRDLTYPYGTIPIDVLDKMSDAADYLAAGKPWVMHCALPSKTTMLPSAPLPRVLFRKTSDFVKVQRKHPSKPSINAAIARPTFKGQSAAELPTAVAINNYNHRMNAVDLAN